MISKKIESRPVSTTYLIHLWGACCCSHRSDFIGLVYISIPAIVYAFLFMYFLLKHFKNGFQEFMYFFYPFLITVRNIWFVMCDSRLCPNVRVRTSTRLALMSVYLSIVHVLLCCLIFCCPSFVIPLYTLCEYIIVPFCKDKKKITWY